MSLYHVTREDEFKIDIRRDLEEVFLFSNSKQECPPTHLSSVILGRFMLPVLFHDFMLY